MILTKEVQINTRIESGIVCDICQKQYTLIPDYLDILKAQEFFRIRRTGGFSSVFGDMKYLSIDICDDCFCRMLTNELGEAGLQKHIKNGESEDYEIEML